MRRNLIFWLLPALLTGCVTHHFEHIRETATGIIGSESTVILGRQNHLGYEADVAMVDCLRRQMRRVKITDNEDFTQSLYPWFEPRLAPTNIEEMKALLSHPQITERLAIANIRYLVWVESDLTSLEKRGSMACAAGTGFGGCFGFLAWDDKAKYEVAVWDLKNQVVSGQMRNEAHGTSVVVGALIPIPLVASVKKASCGVVAKKLSAFIRGK